MDTDALQHQAGAAVIAVYLIEWLKRSKWCPWLTVDSGRITKIVALVSAVMGAGISISATGSIDEGGKLVITYGSLSTLREAAMHVGMQLGIQEGFYQKVMKRDVVPEEKKMVGID